jgi:hypothetical protein
MLFVLAVSAAMAASDYAALNRLKELHHLFVLAKNCSPATPSSAQNLSGRELEEEQD